VEASSFFVIDQVVSSILGVVNTLLVGLGSVIPGMGGMTAFLGRVLRTSLGYADEVILALSFRTRSSDVWRTSRDGVVLYAQNYKTILKNAFALAVIHYLLVFVLFVMAWVPATWIAGLMPGSGSALLAFVVTILLVYSLKKAFIEPFLMAALMQVYFQCIEGQTPNPAWIEKLGGMSEKFRSMQSKFRDEPAAMALAPAPLAQAPLAPAPLAQAPLAPAPEPQTQAPIARAAAPIRLSQPWQTSMDIAPTEPMAKRPQHSSPAPGSTTLPLGLANRN
jgi:hypothetical protein